MGAFITTKEASEKWGISSRRINVLCSEGRIPGAYKEEKHWMIPAEAAKPADKRVKYARHTSQKNMVESYAGSVQKKSDKKLPLPIGISDHCKACEGYYYVDKTLLIRDFIDERPQVSLFTRPRRFGKTLNMDMLRAFFEKNNKDTSIYFRDKKIWACGPEYQVYQGKYPVISVTFKDVKCETWEAAYEYIYQILRNEFERHGELLDSEKISSYEKKYVLKVLSGEAGETDMRMAFLNLSRLLHKHHEVAPIIIIDEYDTPIQQGHVRGYYEKVVDFMRALFSSGLKDNPHLSYGFLTGILRVAKESIFSGLNNLKINSVLDNRYSEYFGFTPAEVREMAEYYGVSEKFKEICEWYDGYRFGNSEIFNPWSVVGYFDNECIPRAFWLSTGNNDIISELLSIATPEIMENLEALMQGKSFTASIDTSVIYPQLQENPFTIYSFLLVTGYLKAVNRVSSFVGDYICEVALPNKEISYVYSKEILSRLDGMIPSSLAIAVQVAIYSMDVSALQKKLSDFLLHTVSYFDTTNETFYHGWMLGLCAVLDNRYRITSNREAGKGRFDIQMLPLDKRLPGILLELKATKDSSEAQLEEFATSALEQIKNRKYFVELEDCGITDILNYGIAFSGKDVCVKAERITSHKNLTQL